MGECSNPFPMQLIWDAAAKQMQLRSTAPLQHNKKIPPNTVLCMCKDGRVEPSDTGGVVFAFSNARREKVCESGTGTVKLLHEFLQSTSAKSIVKHGAIATSGTSGLATTVKPPGCRFEFVPAKKEIQAFLAAVVGRSMVGALWILRARAGEAQPHGVAIVALRQLTMPAAGVLLLE